MENELEAVGIGSLNYDYIHMVYSLAHGDQQVVVQSTHGNPGGSAANTIFALSRLGMKTGFIGPVGNDVEGQNILKNMAEEGIDITMIKMLKGTNTAKVLVFVDRTGERAMYSLPGANLESHFGESEIGYVNKSKYLILSAIPGDRSLTKQIALMKQISEKVKLVFLPGGLYSGLGITAIRTILKHTNILVLNRTELKKLTNMGEDYNLGMARLLKIGCLNVVLTTGKDGCVIKTPDTLETIPTPHLDPEKIVDTTGAGDAFAAGLVYGLLTGKSLFHSSFYGNILARNCIQFLGSRTGLLTKQELETEFVKFSKEILNGH